MSFLPSDEDKKRADDHLARMSPHYRKEAQGWLEIAAANEERYTRALARIAELERDMDDEVLKREQFEEEVWCAHKWLDDQSIPRADVGGEVFSLVGRMMRLTEQTRK